ncbi:helix-turn-helix domain-containing protein, partial [Klebsiella pneumoniae]|uniref:helix-turn-helix domain-containing protein n=1 Tax=Klebsiella pneumoniae TaxID=573 RepID=UPI003C6D6EC5
MGSEQHDFNWGRWIRHQRSRRGWTQQEVANKIGATPLTVSRWERGQETPRPSFQDKLSALFE